LSQVQQLERVVIRFAGDSGDGMQLTGDRFTAESAVFGNDLATLPSFPAEIRAPQGTLAGVSSFQVHVSSEEVLTPGDAPDVLIAMNPAALRANVKDVRRGGTVIVDSYEFTQRNISKAGYKAHPLEDGSLGDLNVHELDLTSMTMESVKHYGLGRKDAARAKNMFSLGLISWMYSRPRQSTEEFIEAKFASKPDVRDANLAAYRAGFNYGETAEAFSVSYEIAPARMTPGVYRNVTGNLALSYGLMAAARLAGLPLFLGAYPITPATDILQTLTKLAKFGATVFQAEDEIAGICAAIGASYGGALGVTSTSGPGMALKSEAIGLAISLELPLVIVDVQRGGPSTGLPTKTEQSDLLQAMYGRNGEAPLPVFAPRSPADCFDTAIEAARVAIDFRTPVILLSDGYLANGSEPWRVPDVRHFPAIDPRFATEPNHETETGDREFWPYQRDADTLARPWAIPGTPDLMHRIGGIEKADGHGNISYDPANHDHMVRTRAAKVERVSAVIGDTVVDDPGEHSKVLVIGWGSTYGPAAAACRALRDQGHSIAQAHLRHINPFPHDLGEVLSRYDRVVCPEMNLGQLSILLRSQYLVDVVGINQVRGMPFQVRELEVELLRHLKEVE
jgi:2-oxoglutarate ferredoxin oxidoreductase subunit alpha